MFRIEADRARFREIVRGRIRADLRRYLSTGELIGRAGEHAVSIPLPQIELPRFVFDEKSAEEVLQYVAALFARGDAKRTAPEAA
jgi:uncharacterized sporulation protein YeaH/YhbH (DUF444 family)